MSDGFDSLDATEKAAVEGALNNAKRPSDNVVQTAPVKCRYTKSGVCANIAGFCLCRQANFALPSSHDARTGKALHDALGPVLMAATNKSLAQRNKSRTGAERLRNRTDNDGYSDEEMCPMSRKARIRRPLP